METKSPKTKKETIEFFRKELERATTNPYYENEYNELEYILGCLEGRYT